MGANVIGFPRKKSRSIAFFSLILAWSAGLHWHVKKEVLPHVLFQVARLLVGLTAILALIRSVISYYFQKLLESQARVLGWDEAY